MAEVQQSFTTPISAPLDVCYAAIADFEAYPRWSSPITSIQVLDRHPDGQVRRVEFVVDLKVGTVRYVLEYTWHPPNRLTWKMTEATLPTSRAATCSKRTAPRGRRRPARKRSRSDSGSRA